MKHYFLTLLFGLFALGCSEQPATTQNNRVAVKEASYSFAIPPNTPAASPEQTLKMRKIETEAHIIIMGNLSHEKAHEKLQPLLTRAQNLTDAYSFEQSVAMTMLDQRLLQSETLTPAELKIVGFYTDLLLKWKNPDASIIQPALAKLEGTWSQEKIQQAKNTALTAATEWMQKQGKPVCKDCSTTEKDLDQSKFGQISASVQALQRAE
ncbi:MAG: hypothetical protein JNN12_09160 [Bacteroidetes Order II. Incertae sedis bacterium]|nr:hypothetical protein [Bacteroidetes Order II. bacterium]